MHIAGEASGEADSVGAEVAAAGVVGVAEAWVEHQGTEVGGTPLIKYQNSLRAAFVDKN